MDQKISELFENAVNPELLGIVISNSADKDRISKVRIRPVLIREQILYQVSEYKGTKVFHTNLGKEELLDRLPDWFEGLFHQAEITTQSSKAILLISKKGKITIINKIRNAGASSDNAGAITGMQRESLQHNRKKNYILQEGIPLPFLIDLGVMTPEGSIVKAKSDKFRQINRFLEYIEDVLPYLDRQKELNILDFGCGKSYLTFAMYYYLKILKDYQISIIGLDLKQDVIEECNRLSEKYGYDKLHFLVGDIASYQGSRHIDVVVTLHACDTATDYALYQAVSWGADVILSVPCCQHELNRQIRNDVLAPVLKHGIIKERMSALITDALRAGLLETKGYQVQLLEFIDMEHTPKNIMIRAVRTNGKNQAKALEKLKECMDFLNVDPCLYRLFQKD